jgi:hypothetical protein
LAKAEVKTTSRERMAKDELETSELKSTSSSGAKPKAAPSRVKEVRARLHIKESSEKRKRLPQYTVANMQTDP